MDEGGISQQVMQENVISFSFLNTHYETYTYHTLDYTNYLLM